MKKICSQELPGFNREIDLALVTLAPKSEGERKLAALYSIAPQSYSIAPQSYSISQLATKEKERWLDWSKNELAVIEKILDWISEEPEYYQARLDLSEVGNFMIYFYGYIEQGNTERMTSTLREILRRTQKIKQESCSKAL